MYVEMYVNKNAVNDLGIRLIESLILDMIARFGSWAERVMLNGRQFMWIARTVIAKYLPIKLKPDTVWRILKKLDKEGLIEYEKDGKKDCIRLTKLALQYFSPAPKAIDIPSENESSPIDDSESPLKPATETLRSFEPEPEPPVIEVVEPEPIEDTPIVEPEPITIELEEVTQEQRDNETDEEKKARLLATFDKLEGYGQAISQPKPKPKPEPESIFNPNPQAHKKHNDEVFTGRIIEGEVNHPVKEKTLAIESPAKPDRPRITGSADQCLQRYQKKGFVWPSFMQETIIMDYEMDRADRGNKLTDVGRRRLVVQCDGFSTDEIDYALGVAIDKAQIRIYVKSGVTNNEENEQARQQDLLRNGGSIAEKRRNHFGKGAAPSDAALNCQNFY